MEDIITTLQRENEELKAELVGLRQEIALNRGLQEYFKVDTQNATCQALTEDNRALNIQASKENAQEDTRSGAYSNITGQSVKFQLDLIVGSLQNVKQSIERSMLVEKVTTE